MKQAFNLRYLISFFLQLLDTGAFSGTTGGWTTKMHQFTPICFPIQTVEQRGPRRFCGWNMGERSAIPSAETEVPGVYGTFSQVLHQGIFFPVSGESVPSNSTHCITGFVFSQYQKAALMAI